MDIRELEAERIYLNDTKQAIDFLLLENSDEMKNEDFLINNLQKYFNDNKIDDQEEAYILTELYKHNGFAEKAQKDIKQLKKIRKHPFFAKIIIDDRFKKNDALYIGLKSIQKDNDILVVDWRAPISSIYYNSLLGRSTYDAPEGKEAVNLKLKRQFKIENEKLKYYIDTDDKIDDDVLQKVLSENTSSNLKNIVQSIQEEQNKIIRESSSSNIILTGIAGSGKTSIAMHRIAYLLYLNKGDITSENFLIISPNNLFSKYVGGLLPELGEDEVPVASLKGLASVRTVLAKNTFNRESLLEDLLKNQNRLPKIKTKFSLDYYKKLCDFITQFNSPKTFKGFVFEKKNITSELIENFYYIGKDKWNINESLTTLIDRIIDNLFSNYTKTKQDIIADRLMQLLKNQLDVKKMFSLFLGRDFDENLDYENFSTLAFLEMAISGFKPNTQAKYVFVDEVQDYDAVSLKILQMIFPNVIMTIVGDYNQNLLFLDSNKEALKFHFGNSLFYNLEKSYRSTTNITDFANKILGINSKTINIRSGNEPNLTKATTKRKNAENISNKITEYLKKGYSKIAIICKTREEAKSISNIFKKIPMVLNEEDAKYFTSKVIITTTYLSKGLEFDAVIIPNATSENFNTKQDRQFLYVAATRALHELSLFYTVNKSKFL